MKQLREVCGAAWSWNRRVKPGMMWKPHQTAEQSDLKGCQRNTRGCCLFGKEFQDYFQSLGTAEAHPRR